MGRHGLEEPQLLAVGLAQPGVLIEPIGLNPSERPHGDVEDREGGHRVTLAIRQRPCSDLPRPAQDLRGVPSTRELGKPQRGRRTAPFCPIRARLRLR